MCQRTSSWGTDWEGACKCGVEVGRLLCEDSLMRKDMLTTKFDGDI